MAEQDIRVTPDVLRQLAARHDAIADEIASAHSAGQIGPPVVAPTQVVLEPHVQDDEGIATSHLLQPELRDAVHTVGPCDRHDGIGISADDGLQWHFNR